jgi:hypothetical protein
LARDGRSPRGFGVEVRWRKVVLFDHYDLTLADTISASNTSVIERGGVDKSDLPATLKRSKDTGGIRERCPSHLCSGKHN